MEQGAFGIGMVARAQLRGADDLQVLAIVGIAGQHILAIEKNAAVVIQVHGGLHQSALDLGPLWRIGILLQMMFEGVRHLDGAVAGFADGLPQSLLLG